MQHLAKGILITVEGIDGSGKSTLVKNLAQYLKKENFPHIITKEPGGTALGINLRKILQERTIKICDKSEYLLFAADRAEHCKEIIIPSLQEKKIIISDRSKYSSLAYQGYARGLDPKIIDTINNWAMNNIEYDLIFYVKIDTETAWKRIIERNQDLTHFEKEKKSFTEKILNGFNEIFKNKKNVIILDGCQSIEQLTQDTINNLNNLLKYYVTNKF